MSFEPNLSIGQVIDNAKLVSEFGCSSQGGMRRSKATNTLVLVSNHVGKGIYDDKKIGNVFHYTGMGMSGDQELSFMQNKTLAESNNNKVDVHFFEVFKEREYTYLGKVELNDSPYQETQEDEDGITRKVWMFPLKVMSYENPLTIIDEDVINSVFKDKSKVAARLSNEQLKNAATKTESSIVSSRKTSASTYIRNPYVTEYAKRLANGICQLCGGAAPFNNSNGRPYLETHHIQWLSIGGPDTINNTVALCPNCHRKMHVLNIKEDKDKLLSIAL